MKKHITVKQAETADYDKIITLYNDGFLSKFNFVTKEKADSCVHDFGVLDLETGEMFYVAKEGNRPLGLLVLKHKNQMKRGIKTNLSFWKLLKKYRLSGIIRILLLDRLIRFEPGEGELHIDSLVVSQAARGKGIGTRLLDFAEKFARERGFTRLSLHVMYENQRAKVLYKRIGFERKNSIDIGWFKKRTGYSGYHYMVRNLSA